jgi:hypothetical protein
MAHTRRTISTLICSFVIVSAPLLGGIKMQVMKGRPVVDGVFVNGHGPYRFLVDTGANVNLIETHLARKIGMSVTLQVDLASVASTTALEGSDGNEIVLDSVEAGRQEFLFSPLTAIHEISPGIQGLLEGVSRSVRLSD